MFPGKGPTGQAVRPRQGDIGSLRKTKTERGGGKTLPSYITLPPWQGKEKKKKKSSPPQCKEKPVHPPLLGLQKKKEELRHFRTGIRATLKPAVLARSYTIVASLQTHHHHRHVKQQPRLNVHAEKLAVGSRRRRRRRSLSLACLKPLFCFCAAV